MASEDVLKNCGEAARNWMEGARQFLLEELRAPLSVREGSRLPKWGLYFDGLARGEHYGLAIDSKTCGATLVLDKSLQIDSPGNFELEGPLPNRGPGDCHQYDLVKVDPKQDSFSNAVGRQILEALGSIRAD